MNSTNGFTGTRGIYSAVCFGLAYVTIVIDYCSIHRDINNGVYRAGFATSQEAYDKAVGNLFAGLDRVGDILSKQRYLAGSQLTEADVRLYTTLVRFDCVYVGFFKVLKADSLNCFIGLRCVCVIRILSQSMLVYHKIHNPTW